MRNLIGVPVEVVPIDGAPIRTLSQTAESYFDVGFVFTEWEFLNRGDHILVNNHSVRTHTSNEHQQQGCNSDYFLHMFIG